MQHPLTHKKERAISAEASYIIIDHALWAVLSMVDPEGHPYAIPLSTVRDGSKIYFHCHAQKGFKLECLRAHPQVCLVFIGNCFTVPEKATMDYESVLVRGMAEEVKDEAEYLHALLSLCEHYGTTNSAGLLSKYRKQTAIWSVTIEEVSGKANHPKP